jgi:hypothetical protein
MLIHSYALLNTLPFTNMSAQMAVCWPPCTPLHLTRLGLARSVYIHHAWHTTEYFPPKNTVYTPYIYGSGQPYTYPIVVICSSLQDCGWQGNDSRHGLTVKFQDTNKV